MNTNKATKIALKSGLGNSAKDILLSIIGTTISIILTFGTSSLIDHYQEKKSRKLFAMTVIHEIDKDIEQIRTVAENDYELYKIIQYIDKFDELDSVPKDSLTKIRRHSFSYWSTPPEFSKSNEQIFNSSQNIWSTIDNNIFISNVQDYYRLRAKLECALKEDSCFLPYVSYKDMFKIVCVDGDYRIENDVEFARKLNLNAISKKARNRISFYNTLLAYQSINEENKILMGISDKDLEEFVKKTADATIVSKDGLIGAWMIKNYEIDLYGSYNHGNIFTFHKNNTITVHCQKKYVGAKSGAGDIWVYYTATGDWKIEGDSLVMTFPDDKIEVKIDDNDFYYSNISHLRETQKNIKRDFISEFCSDLGGDYYATAPYIISVSAFIDRLGRAITIRSPRLTKPKRFERCDTVTIPKYDFVKHPASEKEILGKWAWYEDANTIQMEFDNKKDHSFTIRKVDKERNADLFDGVMLVNRTISGEWKMENDSVVYYFDTMTLNLSIDDSRITYSPDKAGAVKGFKRQLSDLYTQRTSQSPRVAYQAIVNAKRTEMIDKDGNVMFLYQ